MDILTIIKNAYGGYASYVFHEITSPSWHNYFYWLIGISLFFFTLEWFKPWRENQPKFRKDFWLDFFYMFFNFFLFSLIIYNAASDVIVNLFNLGIQSLSGFDLQASNPMRSWPAWGILLTGFLVRDFVQWWVHRLLHRVEFLWNFHKVHHSVEQMGFAAHLRYHWMETIVYRSIEYIPLALLGIGLYDFFIIHIFTIAIGHYNHSNITVSGKVSGGFIGLLIAIAVTNGIADIHIAEQQNMWIRLTIGAGIVFAGIFVLGPFMKKIFNSPEMHIWHHAYDIPKNKPYGINFGITLAIWDYLFGTAVIPHDGKDIRLGFPGMDNFPKTFSGQAMYGLKKE
jgi:sterol desaturase/sphingolipid hydroxylase (fatty acid hydroxylase superfamily)